MTRYGLTLHGTTRSPAEWVESGTCPEGVTVQVIGYRIGHGWSVEEALLTPLREAPTALYELHGEVKTITEWSRDPRCVPAFRTLQRRLQRGWDFEDALTRPVQKHRK